MLGLNAAGLLALQVQEQGEEAFVPADWAEPWWDLGPGGRWAVAVAALGVWLVVVGFVAWRMRPGRVRAGMGVVQLPSDDPPAVVDLITNSWVPEHEAVPATLLDLAARGYVSIHQSGELASVHVPARRPEGEQPLTSYEDMVLRHVEGLAAKTRDRVLPAGALTTGPDDQAKSWWKRFRSAVEGDAVARGLARPRWPGGAKAALILIGLIPSAVVGLAFAWTVYAGTSADEDMTDNGRLGAGLLYGFFVWIALAVFVGMRRGVKDTPYGRQVAEQWLGLRQFLASDPTFTEHDPSGVSVWGRRLAYGAALGLAHGAVHGLPLGAENDREIWSAYTGAWRVLHVRYPRWYHMGAGQSPGLTIFFSLITMGPVFFLSVYSLNLFDGGSFGDDAWLVGMLFAPMLLMMFLGFFPLVLGVSDLISPKHTVQGEVLRIRKKGSGKSERWFVVVDDGRSSHVGAWKFSSSHQIGYSERAIVRAQVSRWLRHVSGVQVLEPATTPGQPEVDEADWRGVVHTLAEQASTGPVSEAGSTGAVATGSVASDDPRRLTFPSADAISNIVGARVQVERNANVHPLAYKQNGVTYNVSGPDGSSRGMVQIIQVDHGSIDKLSKGGFMWRPIEGVGDLAYRLRVGGSIFARQGDRGVMVSVGMTGLGNKTDRHRVAMEITQLALRPASF